MAIRQKIMFLRVLNTVLNFASSVLEKTKLNLYATFALRSNPKAASV